MDSHTWAVTHGQAYMSRHTRASIHGQTHVQAGIHGHAGIHEQAYTGRHTWAGTQYERLDTTQSLTHNTKAGMCGAVCTRGMHLWLYAFNIDAGMHTQAGMHHR